MDRRRLLILSSVSVGTFMATLDGRIVDISLLCALGIVTSAVRGGASPGRERGGNTSVDARGDGDAVPARDRAGGPRRAGVATARARRDDTPS